MNSFAKSRCLEVMGAGGRVCYAGLLHIAYPYRVDLGAGVSSARVCFIVYVSIVIFAGSVMSEPAGRRAATPLRGAVSFLRLFSFFSAVRRLRFAFAVFSLAPRASEFLPIGVTRVWDA